MEGWEGTWSGQNILPFNLHVSSFHLLNNKGLKKGIQTSVSAEMALLPCLERHKSYQKKTVQWTPMGSNYIIKKVSYYGDSVSYL